MRVEDPVKDARGGFVNPEVPCQERPTALEAEPTDKVALTVVSGLETPVGESLEAEVSPGPSALDMLSLILENEQPVLYYQTDSVRLVDHVECLDAS